MSPTFLDEGDFLVAGEALRLVALFGGGFGFGLLDAARFVGVLLSALPT